MRKDNLTPLQYGFLAFSFLYGGTLLTPGAYRAEETAWLAALLGCGAGLLWIAFLGRLAEEGKQGNKPSSLWRAAALGLLLFLLLFDLADFGTFWSRQFLPGIPPAICAMALFALSLFAVYHGAGAIGRFAELSGFVLIPLLLILFPGLLGGDWSRLGVPQTAEDALETAKSGLGVFVSAFGDSLALGILGVDVLFPDEAGATVYAKASASASADALPLLSRLRPKKHRLPCMLLLGALPAALLFVLTVAGNQARLGAHLLASASYPVAFASSLLHQQVLDPLFILCLTLLYAVKTSVLLLSICRLLASLLPRRISHTAPVPVTLATFGFLLLFSLLPDLTDWARNSLLLFGVLTIAEISLPIARQISLFLQKRFDKSPDL